MISFFKRLFSNCCPVCPPAPPVPVPPAPPSPTVCPIVPGPTIAMVNMSTVISDAQIAAATAALQVQLDRDFAPVWNMTAHLVAIPSGQQPAADAWVIYIMDTSDQAGALGYHDLTPAGNPVGKVFAKDDKKYGLTWTVTLSHELLEMIADPWICNVSFDQKTNTTGTLYAWEVADAVEADQFAYTIDGILVSDFVYPTWFEGWRQPGSAKFDQQGVLKAPLSLAPGGYIGIFTVPTSSGWTQKFAETKAATPSRAGIKGQYGRIARRRPITRL